MTSLALSILSLAAAIALALNLARHIDRLAARVEELEKRLEGESKKP